MTMRKILLILLLLLAAPLWAQPGSVPVQGQTPVRYIPPGSLDAQSHLVQIGDQLEIDVYAMPELAKVYVVRADGCFFHPVAGEVRAAGRTVDDIQADLKKKLKKELRYPAFKMGLHSVAESQASTLGEVKMQGKFSINPGTSVLDLLAMAGGITPKADLDGAVLIRDGKQIAVPMGPAGQAEAAKVIVRAGDILFVNQGRRISVSGEVYEKGTFAVSKNSLNPIEDAIKAAGGAKETAALSRVMVNRPTLKEPIIVDLLNKDAKLPVLEDGDTVAVPARRCVLMGAVDKPGAIPMVGNESLVDIISQAGTSRGRLDQVFVIRSADVIAGNDKKEQYNLEESLSEGKLKSPVMIYDGDVVYVPAKADPNAGGFLNGGIFNLLLMARSFLHF